MREKKIRRIRLYKRLIVVSDAHSKSHSYVRVDECEKKKNKTQTVVGDGRFLFDRRRGARGISCTGFLWGFFFLLFSTCCSPLIHVRDRLIIRVLIAPDVNSRDIVSSPVPRDLIAADDRVAACLKHFVNRYYTLRIAKQWFIEPLVRFTVSSMRVPFFLKTDLNVS